MRNITLAVDDEVLAGYRLLAAEQRTTVNAMVRKHMEEATGAAARRRAALERLARVSHESEAFDEAHPAIDPAQGARFSREDTYTGPRFEWPRS